MTKKNNNEMEGLFYDDQSFDVKDECSAWKVAFFSLLGVSIFLLGFLVYLLLQ